MTKCFGVLKGLGRHRQLPERSQRTGRSRQPSSARNLLECRLFEPYPAGGDSWPARLRIGVISPGPKTARRVKGTAGRAKTLHAVNPSVRPLRASPLEGQRFIPLTRRNSVMNETLKSLAVVGASLVTSFAAAAPNPATDARIDPQVRAFLAEINKDNSPFWELPQPKPQDILTALQSQTPVDTSGVTTTEKTITENGRTVKLYVMRPEHVSGKPGILFFIHGGVWIVGNFQNHQRLLRDLVVGSGQIGVFVEYTPLPAAKFPTQLEESYAALKWVSQHAEEIGADGRRIAVAGNSVGGNMTAALSLMAKDRDGPKIGYHRAMMRCWSASPAASSPRSWPTPSAKRCTERPRGRSLRGFRPVHRRLDPTHGRRTRISCWSTTSATSAIRSRPISTRTAFA